MSRIAVADASACDRRRLIWGVHALLGPLVRASCDWAHIGLTVLAGWVVVAPERACAEWRVPVVFHVASKGGEAVTSDAFVAKQLSEANAAFRALALRFVDAGRRVLGEQHAALKSRGDRDALGRFVRPGVINCMVVGSLMDVDEPGRERRGVHWRVRGNRARHFVVLSAAAGSYVLAHELGHFLGNQRHSPKPGNLMSYQGRPGVPTLDLSQIRRVRRTFRALRASGELRVARASP